MGIILFERIVEMEEKESVEKESEEVGDKSAYKRAKTKTWIISAVFVAIFVAIGIIGGLILGAWAGICVAIFAVIVLLVWLPGELKRVKNNFCQECGARYDYQRCVEWEVSDVVIKEKRLNPNSDRKQIAGIRVEHVDFTCTCEKCGNEITFTRKYQTGEVYDDGTVKKRNIESMIKKYFKV